MLLSKFLNFLHIILLIIPPGIFLIPLNSRTIPIMIIISKWLLLLGALIPLHWVFFDNSCILTLMSQQMGNYQDAQTDSEFSENNLKWLYWPIMKKIGWKWNNEGLDKMISLHWIINIILLWTYCFWYIY